MRLFDNSGLVSRLFAAAATVFAIGACTDLPTIEREVCGNHVIDWGVGEECDGLVPKDVMAACLAAYGDEADCTVRCGTASEEGACRYIADGQDTRCPVGYARGVDDICRRPSGQFVELPFARVNSTALDGTIADFDGDGLNDLFLAGSNNDLPSISYFDAAGSIIQTTRIPAVNVSAGFISADRDLDPAADLIVANGPALTTFRGAEGRLLLQKAYAPFVNPVAGAKLYAIPVVPANMADEGVPPGFDRPIARTEMGNAVVYSEIDAATLQVVKHATLAFPSLAGESISEPVFANLLDDGNDMMAFPEGAEAPLEIVEASSSAVYIGKFPSGTQLATIIPAPMGVTIEQLLPVLGGPEPQVAVRTLEGGQRKLRLITPEQPAEPPGFSAPIPLPVLKPDEKVLSVGYLNDDSLFDLVTSEGVRFLVPNQDVLEPLHFTPPYISNFEPFEEATITDLNHDGAREIVTLSKNGDVVMLLPATNYTFNPVPISINGKPRELVTGDFDGDGFDDLLITSATASGCDVEDDLYLLFGNASGLPDAPQLIGSLPGIARVTPIRFYFPFLPDGVSDITIQTKCAADGEPGDFVGVFFGSTSRIVSSPFSPYAGKFSYNPTIERVTTGQIVSPDLDAAPDTHEDVALVATLQQEDVDDPFYERELRLVVVTGDAQMTDTGQALRLVDGVAEGIRDERSLIDHVPAVRAGQLFEGSPSDEIVVLSAYSTDSGAKVTLWVAELDGGALTSAFSADIQAPGVDEFSFSRLKLFDFDADGDLDVVALIVQQRPGPARAWRAPCSSTTAPRCSRRSSTRASSSAASHTTSSS